MIYHLLPKGEIFSEFRGGAVPKLLVNLMSIGSSKVVTSRRASDIWDCSSDQILVPPLLSLYCKLKGRRLLPLWLNKLMLRVVFHGFILNLKNDDVVWCHNDPFYAAALEQSLHRKGAKLIYHCHDRYANRARCSALRSFTADAYIFVSESLRQWWLKRLPNLKSTYAIHNGANENLFHPPLTSHLHNRTPVILYVGRLHPEKGAHLLLEAMRILQSRKLNTVCKMFGSSFAGGSKTTSYMKDIFKLKPSNVYFEGYHLQSKIAEEIRAADILCCPAISQNPYSGVTLEAMACGLPVVSARVQGIPKMLYEGGVVFVEPNSAVQLANVLQKLIEDRNVRLKIGSEGLELFRKKYTWSVISSRYREVIESL